MPKINIQVYANNDDATIVIQSAVDIPGCWGFAIFRKRQQETDLEAEPLLASVGFEGDPHGQDEFRPSTEWPIQKYLWTDYYVKMGDIVCYKVIPMIHSANGLTKDLTNASDWCPFVSIGNSTNSEAYFNRGMVSSQFVARRLNGIPNKEKKAKLKDNLTKEDSVIRQFMGGNLSAALYQLLEGVAGNKDQRVYAALYELDEPGLIKRLNAIGKRAHVILANGAFGDGGNDPQAPHADLLTKVDLTRRIVGTPHFAHNKFLIVTEKQSDGKEHPIKVWTGSTNWTLNGLYTQVNNAVILTDKAVLDYYFAEWAAIRADCDASGRGLYGKKYKEANKDVKVSNNGSIRTYFTPVSDQIDMDEADACINAAQKGILFLMFKPGNEGKSRMLYDTIRQKTTDPKLLINGVINADPGGSKAPTITFIHKNQVQPGGSFDIVTPSNIDDPFSFWDQELAKQNVTIHSKIILIDPFSDNPVLITGSHNMGGKASKSNDDNLNIIRGNKELARAYAIHMTAVYHHYRWRFYRQADTGQPKWDGNVKSDKWQEWYRSGEKAKEIVFWTS
jgi:hypothetical protein